MAEALKSFVTKRGTIKAQLTRFNTYLTSSQEQQNRTKEHLQTRLEIAERLWDRFQDIQSEIEQLDNTQESERLAFEASYFDTIALAKTMLAEKSSAKSAIENMPTSSGQSIEATRTAQVRLPILNLPTFSGAYEEWMQFYDMFNTLIHTNNELSPVQRFHYLRSSLKNEAAQIVSALEITESNYNIAWKLLKERFDNKRIIANNHVKALFELPLVTKDSHVSIRQLLSNVQKHLRSLKALNQPTEQWDILIIHLICTKLDPASRREWENKLGGAEIPTMEHMVEFLTKRSQVLESLSTNTNKSAQIKVLNTQPRQRNNDNSISCVTTSTTNCPVCKKSPHALYKCYKFVGLPVKTRIEEATRLKICFNCLRAGHTASECRSSNCQNCGKKHNTLLHNNETNVRGKPATSTESSSTEGSRASEEHSVSLTCNINRNQTLLPTALIKVYDNNNTSHIVRALLYTGSQSNFITSELFDKLKVKSFNSNIKISGLNQSVTKTSVNCNLKIKSLNEIFSSKITCIVIAQITNNMPSPAIHSSSLQLPLNLDLADPLFNETNSIDMLLGAATFFDVLCKERITLGKKQPVLQNTMLGWIVAGTIISLPPNHTNSTNLLCTTEEALQENLQKFWELEGTATTRKYSKEEEECETHFTETFKRDEEGRFQLEMPLHTEIIEHLGDTKDIAHKRMESLERKFKKYPDLKERYVQFMQEYIDLGHMTKCTEENMYVLPHHPVLKEESLTTKLRVVFDASAQPARGLSLNQIQKIGPTMQNDLYSILLRFRTHAIVLTADVEKMYRQVLIQNHHRKYQCILWRNEPELLIEQYQLNTITYGTAAAPFMAVRCLIQLGLDNKLTYPEASEVIHNDFYVDDLLTGAKDVNKALQLYKDISTILDQANFKLRKWASNSAELLSKISTNTANVNPVYVCENTQVKTLGIQWSPIEDVFQYTVHLDGDEHKLTKRVVLSIISKIYDPLGLLSPITIIAKIFMQKLWQIQLEWDESLTEDLHNEWYNFKQSMQQAKQLTIPRHIICSLAVNVEMHACCDASEKAYAACIYLRTNDENQNTSIHLVCSKTKVAPLKTITVPRLELCGALLLTKLAIKTKQSLNLPINRTVFWTDSTIVLCWINTSPNLLKTFVSNRVTEIQNGTTCDSWRHVPTNDNPADIASRGTNMQVLQESEIWWHGPKWLAQEESHWPSAVNIDTNEILEMKTQAQACLTTTEQTIFVSKYSTLNKLVRVVSYILRFKENSLNKKGLNGPLTVKELENAETCVIKMVQSESFPEEIKALKLKLVKKSKLSSLNPFLDSKGLLRVVGRLTNSNFEFDKKHPIVLEGKHHLTRLIFKSMHIKLMHAGPQLLLSHVREKYWPLGGRNVARETVRQCVMCFRVQPRNLETIMGDLPKNRIEISYPFNISGVDYAGPFILKDRKGRNHKLVKCYVCLFICFVTKAMHLELVSELTTEAFIMTLRRFIARRGCPRHIYSDNGTNFVGAKNKLNELTDFLKTYETKLIDLCAQERITWHFIPAYSPHFGGLWEAGVKSTKHHLRRVLGNAKLTFEEFYTALVQIEAILNSRPLSRISQDPNDLNPITPSHFLIGRLLTSIADPNLKATPENRLSTYQRIQQLQQHFWSRWSKEYISELQQRQRWKVNQQAIRIGTIVLIKDDNLPPLQWLLGRVEEVHPGNDGVIRVVSIRTTKGTIKRAIGKICSLPTEDKYSESDMGNLVL